MKRSKYSYYENAIQLRLNDGLSVSGIAKDICSGDESLVYNSLRCHINDGIKNGKYTAVSVETSTGNDTVGDDYKEPHAFGQAFTDYCSRMQINPENVESAKAINHLAGGQEFNIVLKSAANVAVDPVDMENLLSVYAEKMAALTCEYTHAELPTNGENVGFINVNDVHLGMNPNEGNTGLSGLWSEAEYAAAIKNAVSSLLEIEYREIHINLIGDIADGQDGKTTRGKTGASSHKLPQNLNNIQQFEGVSTFITCLASMVKARFEGVKIHVHALSNSNHGGDLEYFALRLAQTNLLYLFNIPMDIERKHIMSYRVAGADGGKSQDVVLIHGKDEQYQKRGLPFELTSELMHEVRDLMTHTGVEGVKPLLFRADLHQSKVSYLRKFIDILCPAWCPSSQYAQANYYAYDNGSTLSAVMDMRTGQLITYVTNF